MLMSELPFSDDDVPLLNDVLVFSKDSFVGRFAPCSVYRHICLA